MNPTTRIDALEAAYYKGAIDDPPRPAQTYTSSDSHMRRTTGDDDDGPGLSKRSLARLTAAEHAIEWACRLNETATR